MKRLRLLSLVSILFLVNIQIVSAQYVFTAEPFTDELDDGLDFSARARSRIGRSPISESRLETANPADREDNLKA